MQEELHHFKYKSVRPNLPKWIDLQTLLLPSRQSHPLECYQDHPDRVHHLEQQQHQGPNLDEGLKIKKEQNSKVRHGPQALQLAGA